MKQRLAYLLKVYLLTIVLFVTAKVVFMLANSEGHAFAMTDVLDVVRHGLSLDLSTSLYFLILPFCVVAVSAWWESRVLLTILKAYYAVMAFMLMLAFVADTSLYPFWGFKLDASCLQYLETPAEARASVSGTYMSIRLLAIIAGAVVIFLFYRAIPFWKRKPSSRRSSTIAHLLLVPLIVIGIRGGLDESTTNIGQVYYSQNQFLNHSAVNPVFNFFYSVGHTLDSIDQYGFMSEEECRSLTAPVYTTASTDTDTLLTTTRPHVVIILLESCGEEFAQAMPYLQRLKKDGIYFANCYGNSWRTDRGTVCTLSGYPSFPSLSVMKMPEKSRTLPALARTLQKEGYQTSFLYGGDINFTNMRSYLIATGWERLISKEDFTKQEQGTAKWGVRDDITFQTLTSLIPQDSVSTAPKLIGYSTLSSHEPWDVPTKKHPDEVLNAFAYLDDCLKAFIEPLRQTPAWKNLLIVMLADHGINYRDLNQTKLARNHIPMLWVGGAVRQPRRIDKLCNQSDLAATLLGQLQLPHQEYAFSRDVLSSSYRYPTAVNNYSNAQMLIDSTGHILYDFDTKRFVVSNSRDSERLLRLNKAILQATTNDLRQR